MSVGTPFHPRTAPLNRKMQWREWSGYFASSVYADAHDIEYNAIREAAALIDVSPLYKYLVSGPDAMRLVDRVITRDATKLPVGGVSTRRGATRTARSSTTARSTASTSGCYRWTAADPQLRWLRQNSAGLDVHDRRGDRGDRRARAPGPAVARRPRGRDRRVVRRPALLPAARLARSARSRSTCRGPGYTGDLGYELWIPTQGRGRGLGRADRGRRGLRDPAGRDARARRRPSRGRADPARGRLHVGPPRDEPRAELLARSRSGSGGWSASTRATSSAGSRSSARRAAGGPARRLVGLQLDWYDIEGLYDAQGLPPAISPTVDRSPVPVFAGGRQVGRATSLGWSPILKQAIALGVRAAAVRGAGHDGWPSNGRSRAGAAGSVRPSSSCRSWTWSASGPDRRRPERRTVMPDSGTSTTCSARNQTCSS